MSCQLTPARLTVLARPLTAMIFKIPSFSHVENPATVSMRCPSCRQQGTFEPIPGVRDGTTGDSFFGQRKCPNPDCQTHVFVVHQSRSVLVSYPPERIDFDATDIPAKVTSVFEEALTCHAASCFVAAGMMIRKTLEALCEDRGANGSDLKGATEKPRNQDRLAAGAAGSRRRSSSIGKRRRTYRIPRL